jgi:hypothetical protein
MQNLEDFPGARDTIMARDKIYVGPDKPRPDLSREYESRRAIYCVANVIDGPEKVGGAGQSTLRNPDGRRIYDRFHDFAIKARIVQRLWIGCREKGLKVDLTDLCKHEPLVFLMARNGIMNYVPIVLDIVDPVSNEFRTVESKGAWESAHAEQEEFWIRCLGTQMPFGSNRMRAAQSIADAYAQFGDEYGDFMLHHFDDNDIPIFDGYDLESDFSFMNPLGTVKIVRMLNNLGRLVNSGEFAIDKHMAVRSNKILKEMILVLRTSSGTVNASTFVRKTLLYALKVCLTDREQHPKRRRKLNLMKMPFHPVLDRINYHEVFSGEHMTLLPGNSSGKKFKVCPVFKYDSALYPQVCNNYFPHSLKDRDFNRIQSGTCICERFPDLKCSYMAKSNMHHCLTTDLSLITELGERGALIGDYAGLRELMEKGSKFKANKLIDLKDFKARNYCVYFVLIQLVSFHCSELLSEMS